MGGITDGELGWGKAYYNGIVYEPLFSPPVIISGRIYYNMFPQGFTGGLSGVICTDLRTGEEIWRNDDMPAISRGQVFNFEGGSHHGACAYLWSTSGPSWQLFDAFSGRLLATLENTTSETAAYGSIAAGSGKFAYGPNGELLMYILDGESNRLTMWNSTLAFFTSSSSWDPAGTINWTKGIQWSVEVPDVPGIQTMSLLDYDTGVIIAESTIAAPTFIHIGYSMTTGAQLWVQNRTGYGYGFSGATMPPGLLSMFSPCRTLNDGVYTFFYKEEQRFVAFDAKTGNFLWKTEPISKFTNNDFSMYDWAPRIAYGKLYVTGYTGSVSAFNLTTGEHLWTYTQGSSGFDTPYGSWSCIDGVVPADNKIYVPCMEHTPQTPMYQGYTLYCLDAETGDFLWKIAAFLTNVAVADGYIVGANGYDQQIYCYGKGPSALTVTAPDTAATMGKSVIIKGTVADISAGTEQVASRFPSGVPAVSDESMTEWMEYVYMQKPKPTNATGVEVILDVLDANGNYRNIGNATSDANGFYSFEWKPDIPGKFTVYAKFAGSESYYGSSAETAFVVEEAPQATPPPTPEPASAADLYFLPMSAATIIAIIVVAVLVVLLFRKK
ncbi:MAG: PQQ-binding-like beta-propeller repeat protein [Candidatus Bathyarchaeota archaeon]|nr:PQQ-binding-like beta-propeller repeat protein [Candidatus Bathyarchaeota archaeon]